MLINKEDGDFTITELEVWEVKGYVHEDKLVFYDTYELKMERRMKLKELGVQDKGKETETEDEDDDDDSI